MAIDGLLQRAVAGGAARSDGSSSQRLEAWTSRHESGAGSGSDHHDVTVSSPGCWLSFWDLGSARLLRRVRTPTLCAQLVHTQGLQVREDSVFSFPFPFPTPPIPKIFTSLASAAFGGRFNSGCVRARVLCSEVRRGHGKHVTGSQARHKPHPPHPHSPLAFRSMSLLTTVNTPGASGLLNCAASVPGPTACGLIAGTSGGELTLLDLRGLSSSSAAGGGGAGGGGRAQGQQQQAVAAPPPVLAHAYGVRALALSGDLRLLASIGCARPARAPEARGGGGYRAGDSRGRSIAVGTDTSVLQASVDEFPFPLPLFRCCCCCCCCFWWYSCRFFC
jgi:hypothetical protein